MPDNFSLSPLLLFDTISHFLCCLFSRQCVIQLPFLSKCGGNTSIKFQRREKTFFGTLVVASLAYKYCRIIRVHLRNVPFIFYNL